MSEVTITPKLESLIEDLYKETKDIKEVGKKLAECFNNAPNPEMAAATAMAGYTLKSATREDICNLAAVIYDSVFKPNPHACAASAGEESAMSKILKVIGEGPERRTYVEGGLKCVVCEGTLREPDDFEYREGGDHPCVSCDNTGLLNLELWPDAELDRWLAEHFETWDLRMRRELHTNEPTYFVEGEPFIINPPYGDTSRGAKVAAVIAVAEE